MLILNVYFEILPDKHEVFNSLIGELITNSREEPGNICYDLYRSTENSELYILVEKWIDEEALSQHEEFPYFKKITKKFPEILKFPQKVEIYHYENKGN